MPSTEGWWYSCWWVWDLRIPILATRFRLKLTILTFWTKLAQKKCFWSKKKKVNNAIESCIIELVKVSSFTLNSNIDNLDQIYRRRAFPFENEKIEQHHWNKHIQLSLGIKFHLKLTILIFWTRLSQTGYFQPKTKKSKHQHWILHIWISLSIKFHIKPTIFIVWTKFVQKAYSQSKTEKVNITIDFSISELV